MLLVIFVYLFDVVTCCFCSRCVPIFELFLNKIQFGPFILCSVFVRILNVEATGTMRTYMFGYKKLVKFTILYNNIFFQESSLKV